MLTLIKECPSFAFVLVFLMLFITHSPAFLLIVQTHHDERLIIFPGSVDCKEDKKIIPWNEQPFREMRDTKLAALPRGFPT